MSEKAQVLTDIQIAKAKKLGVTGFRVAGTEDPVQIRKVFDRHMDCLEKDDQKRAAQVQR